MDIAFTIYSDVTQRGCAVVLHVGIWGVKQANQYRNCTRIHELLPVLIYIDHYYGKIGNNDLICAVPEWVIFSNAPVALRCTRMSFERASRVSGTRAPDFAIFVLLSSVNTIQLAS